MSDKPACVWREDCIDFGLYLDCGPQGIVDVPVEERSSHPCPSYADSDEDERGGR